MGKNSLFNKNNLTEFFNKSCLKDNKQIFTFLSKVIREYPSLNEYMDKFFKFISNILLIFADNIFPTGLAINILSKNDDDLEIQKSFNRISSVLKDLDISIKKIKG